ncbi:MAG: FAD-binding protein [Acidimicrobiia bacterium]
MTLRIAALVKQIPAFDEMTLGPDGRLVRAGLDLEMSAYCRRAVAQAVELASAHGGSVTILTLGPPTAEDVLREAIAWGIDRDVDTDGVLVSDPAFAGSDTLATARALAAALEVEGPFDVILTGRNSIDADTGQVGPEIAQLVGLPFVTSARHLTLTEGVLDIRAEHDDGWAQVRLSLPAVVSTAERLIDPCKVDPDGRAAVPTERIRVLTATDLGSGPWGDAASPTRVGETRHIPSARLGRRDPTAPIAAQVDAAIALLVERRALSAGHDDDLDVGRVADVADLLAVEIGVIVEPNRDRLTRELLGAARDLDASPVAIVTEALDADAIDELGAWGADSIVHLEGVTLANEQDTAAGVVVWARAIDPWAILAPGTAWGREVASRTAAALMTGLTGDAVELDRDADDLVAWKPAFGGQIVAAIRCTTRPQMATVRSGVLPRRAPRTHTPPVTVIPLEPQSRVEILARTRDDDLDTLADAHVVVGVGVGVDPGEYPRLDPLLAALGAELAATRKVTDQGWLPRARQIGITGRTIAPRLYVSVASNGKFNHMVGVRTAGTILAINSDPDAKVFAAADIGIVGDYRDVVPLLVSRLTEPERGS